MDIVLNSELKRKELLRLGISNGLAIELVKLALKQASQEYSNFIVDEWWAVIIQGLYDKFIPDIALVKTSEITNAENITELRNIILNAHNVSLTPWYKLKYSQIKEGMTVSTARTEESMFTYEEIDGIRVVSLESIVTGLASCIQDGTNDIYELQIDMFKRAMTKLSRRINIQKWMYTLSGTDANNITYALKTIHNKEMKVE